MKKIIFFLLVFPMLLPAQNVPDTIWVEATSDTTFIIAIGRMNVRNSKMNVEYIDQVFDSAGVAEFAFNRIERNEQNQRDADLIKLEADALTSLYANVNSILQDFTGVGYLNNAFQKFKLNYIGYYRARLGGSQVFVHLREDATAVQVNAQGNPVEGGFVGTWDIINPSRFRLKNFFPTNILPAGSVFNRMNNPENAFRAVGSSVVLMKIR